MIMSTGEINQLDLNLGAGKLFTAVSLDNTVRPHCTALINDTALPHYNTNVSQDLEPLAIFSLINLPFVICVFFPFPYRGNIPRPSWLLLKAYQKDAHKW